DGSTDDTQKVLADLQKEALPLSLRFFHQENKGQGAARNFGIDLAHGDIIVFIGDDIVVTPKFLQHHEKLHKAHFEENSAVLGFITWHPKLKITKLMQFMEKGAAVFGRFGGHQFAFDLLKNKEKADARFFYTSNISIKKSLLNKFKFDTEFSGYGWEDIELGTRIEKTVGLNLYYAPEAIAHHDHEMSDKDFKFRMINVGEAVHLIDKKYPELKKNPSGLKKALFLAAGSPLGLFILKVLHKDLYFYALSKKYFLEGLKKGYNKKRFK
ncbi:MAG: glycosyltransferase, partial [Candidatus Gracilibacteria bacterium]